ncbi:MAG: CPBP family intramembrane metalloprotease [Flavobacteriales bacterium]|nr:CPBP family intramembrane metalloprotease [Flavobacteriales bacterium]
MRNLNKVTLFLLLTFGICYSLAAAFYFIGAQYGGGWGTAMAVLYMFVPMIVVLIIEKGIHKQPIKYELSITFSVNRWWFVGWLIMPLIAGLTIGISLFFPDVIYTPGMEGLMERFASSLTPEQMEQAKASMEALPIHPIWLALLQGLIAGITVNALAGFGEELGWRGFLLKQFKHMSFMKASLIIGTIWGIWHAPLILMGHNYPEHPVIGVLMMTVWCILLTPLFNYIALKSQSVIAAAIMHGTLNATAGMAIMIIDGGSDLTVGVTGLAGFIALEVVLIFFFMMDQYLIRDKVFISTIAESEELD